MMQAELAFNKGVTTVWYRITDPNNNMDSCSFDITVLTTIIPPDSAFSSLDEVCPGDGDITLYYDGGVMVEGGTAVWYDDAASDQCDWNWECIDYPGTCSYQHLLCEI